VSFEEGKRIVALKNVSVNEPFFPGTSRTYAVMPGVLIVEAMAQAAAVLSLKTSATRTTASGCTTSSASTARASSARVARRPAADRGRRRASRARHGEVHRGREGRRRGRRRGRALLCALGRELVSQVHPTAVVDQRARLGANVTVGPYTVIDGDVEWARAPRSARTT
jgi:hypothetical protein